MKTDYIVLASLVFVMWGCTKQDRETTIANEIKAIDTYTTSMSASAKAVVINDGSTRIVMKEGTGEPASAGDSVYFKYAAYIFSNGPSTIFDTNLDSLASTLGIEIRNRGFDIGSCIIGQGELIRGLDTGLIGSKTGEYSYVVFPSSLGFGNIKVGIVPKMTSLIYEVWISKIKKR